MRIVDVCAFYSPSGGGVRTYVDAKLRSASKLGHEIVVLVPSEKAEVTEIAPGALIAGIPAPTMPFDRRYRYFNDAARLHSELDIWRPDHVECSSPWSSASAVARWRGSATRSLFMHSDPMAAYAYRWFGFLNPAVVDGLFSRFWDHMRFLGRSFDAVVSPSRKLAERLRQRGLTNVWTVPLGVEGSFSPARHDPELRRSLLADMGLAPEAKLLLSVGRLAPEKRPELIARAVADAARTRPLGLVLVGEGPMRRKLEKIAAASGRIRLLGHISDRDLVARLMASADALVHACEAETFGLVLAEALACGTPVIVPDRGGAFEQLRPGCGLSYPAGAKAGLTRALFELLDSGAFGHKAGGPAAPRLMQDHFRELFGLYGQFGCAEAA
ncbi:MAG: glycosyltransferase [Sphingomicrobium sp.]